MGTTPAWKGPILSHVFAPCSPEKLRYRLKETEEFQNTKKDAVQFSDSDSAEEYRRLEEAGKGVFDKPIYDPEAVDIAIKSSHGDHEIPIRILKPKQSTIKGIYLFIHGGGFVIGSARYHDKTLRELAEQTHMIMASVEYRLAPEFKLPAGTDDCVDAAVYLLSEEAQQKFGHTLRFIGGESAGGYFAVATTIRLRDLGIDVRERLVGIAPTYGIFDLSLLPSVLRHRRKQGQQDESQDILALALPPEVLSSASLIKQPEFSPGYADLHNLPPATFSVGTEDFLKDDSILMATSWELAGNEAELIIYPGTPHGYLVVDLDVTPESIHDIADFIHRHI